MFHRHLVFASLVMILVAGFDRFAAAEPSADSTRKLYEQAAPSLVAVQYTLETEVNRSERVCTGVIVDADGLVMLPQAAVDERIPDSQMKDFKIIIPKVDSEPQELEAVFQGRDERSKVAFVRPKQPQKWTPIQFEDAAPRIGETVYSVGLTPTATGYRTYLMQGTVSGYMGGEVKRIMIGEGGLAATGSPVFNADGKAVGMVNHQPPFPLFLNDRDSMMAIISPPKFVTPTAEFALSLSEPPTAEHPALLGWAGIPDLVALQKEESDRLGLKTQPAVRISAVISDSPADKAGLKRDDIIARFNDKPLDRGGNLQDIVDIFQHKLLCLKPGTPVKLSILNSKDQSLKDVMLTLAPQPKPANLAGRYWTKELGFGVREMVPLDFYTQNLKPDFKGLIVAIVKPGSAASSCRLRINDVLVQFNGQPVNSLDLFESAFEDFRQSHPSDPVSLMVLRAGREENLSCEPPR